MAVPATLLLPGTGSAASSEWVFEDIDPDGLWSDVADFGFDSTGAIQVVYFDGQGLKHADNTGGSWTIEILEMPVTGDVYYLSMVLDTLDRIHVACGVYVQGGSDLVYFTNSGGVWSSEIIAPSVGGGMYQGDGVSMAIDSQGFLHMAYAASFSYDSAEGLVYCNNVGGQWNIEKFDSFPDIAYESPSLIVDSSDNVHISFAFWNNTVEYGTNVGGQWAWSIVHQRENEGTYALLPSSPATALRFDTSGILHIVYGVSLVTDLGGRIDVMHATQAGAGWAEEIVTSLTGDYGGDYCSLAADLTGRLHVGYILTNQSTGTRSVGYSTNEDGQWASMIMNGSEIAGWSTAIEVDPLNVVHFIYQVDRQDYTGSTLVHAYRALIIPDPIAYRMMISAPTGDWVMGAPRDITVTILDQFGAVFTDYAGTVHFSANRSGALLPADYTFRHNDLGVHTFSLAFASSGMFSISCSDSITPRLTATLGNVLVLPEAARLSAIEIAGPSSVSMGYPFSIEARVEDQYGRIWPSYVGTVRFSTTDIAAGVVLPTDYTFTSADGGVHKFPNGFSLMTPGDNTITVSDTAVPTLTSTILVQVMNKHTTYRFYDMFQDEFGPWWWQPSLLTKDPGMYTTTWGTELIYAPLRYSIDADNYTGINVSAPEFLPVFGETRTPGASAKIDLYFQYLSMQWWNDYWVPTWNGSETWIGDDFLTSNDTWNDGVVYEVTMNREAALDWLGMPLEEDPVQWWDSNSMNYSYSVMTDFWLDWEFERLNVDTVVYPWVYGIFASIGEGDSGSVVLKVGMLVSGYEGLMTRWLRETNLSAGFEPWYEDFTMNATFSEDSCDVFTDAIAQDVFHSVRANETEDSPAWAWEPNKIDYWVSSDGTPTVYDPYEYRYYQSWNSAGTSYGSEMYYEYTPTWFNLSASDKLVFELPEGVVPGFKGVGLSWNEWTAFLDNGDQSAFNRIMENGTLELGYSITGWPSGPDLAPMYDSASKTLTITGPMSFDNYRWEDGVLYHGAPWIEFNVVREPEVLGSLGLALGNNLMFAGESNTVSIEAKSQYGDIFENYSGTVTVTSSDPTCSISGDFQFDPATDSGLMTIDFTMNTVGIQTITVTDSANSSLTASATVEVRPAPVASTLMVEMDDLVPQGFSTSLSVTVLDQYGQVFIDYTGTIGFSSSDPAAVLPQEYSFTPLDSGSHLFVSELVLNTEGNQTVTATDVVNSSITGTVTTAVKYYEYAPMTIPQGYPVNFQVYDSPDGLVYHVDSIGTYQFNYDMMGVSAQTLTIGPSGGISVQGYFRFYDNFNTYEQPGRRQLTLYVLGADNLTILKQIDLLNYMNSVNTWYRCEQTLVGLTPGDVVRIGIGRSDHWEIDHMLTAEWRGVEVSRPEDLPPTAPTVAPLANITVRQGKLVKLTAWVGDLNLDQLTFTWDFGDGSPGSNANPVTHIYESPGIYNYTVSVDDGIFVVSRSAQVTVLPGYGILNVSMNAGGMIYVDGWSTTRGSLLGLELPPGNHTVSFGDCYGYATPPAQQIEIAYGTTTEVTASYVQLVRLVVTTNPIVKGTISVDGIPRNEASLDLWLPAGTHNLSFGPVKDYIPPANQTVTLIANQVTTVTGVYTYSSGAQGPDPSTYGLLRVQTSPAVWSTIYVDGVPRNTWGLDWLKLSPGSHTLSFSESIPGYRAPAPMTVTVTAGTTTSILANFNRLAIVQISTSPAAHTTIYFNGVPRTVWGGWMELPGGSYVISFSAVPGYTTPAPMSVYVYSGGTYHYTANFVPEPW